MDNVEDRALTPSMLERVNNQLATQQARQINKGLTRLKRLSSNPPSYAAVLDVDKTDAFITVPLSAIQGERLDAAVEAAKQCLDASTDSTEAKKKKRWFKWAK